MTVPAWSQEKIDPGQLPVTVRQRIEAEGQSVSNIESVTRHMIDGQNIYQIEFRRDDALNPRLRISEAGQLLLGRVQTDTEGPRKVDRDNFARPDLPVKPRSTMSADLADLPEPVRKTVEQHAAGRKIATISMDTIDGREAYTVRFADEGRNPWVYVARDGTLLKPTEKPPAFGLGTQFAETPRAVQETIRREVGTGEIVKIDREDTDAGVVYKVELKNSDGETRQIRVSGNGQLSEDNRGRR